MILIGYVLEAPSAVLHRRAIRAYSSSKTITKGLCIQQILFQTCRFHQNSSSNDLRGFAYIFDEDAASQICMVPSNSASFWIDAEDESQTFNCGFNMLIIAYLQLLVDIRHRAMTTITECFKANPFFRLAAHD